MTGGDERAKNDRRIVGALKTFLFQFRFVVGALQTYFRVTHPARESHTFPREVKLKLRCTEHLIYKINEKKKQYLKMHAHLHTRWHIESSLVCLSATSKRRFEQKKTKKKRIGKGGGGGGKRKVQREWSGRSGFFFPEPFVHIISGAWHTHPGSLSHPSSLSWPLFPFSPSHINIYIYI